MKGLFKLVLLLTDDVGLDHLKVLPLRHLLLGVRLQALVEAGENLAAFD